MSQSPPSSVGESEDRATFLRSSYSYPLPPDRIAQVPPDRRGDSRLLVLDRAARGAGGCSHRRFSDLPALLDPGDLLVLNDTRVIPARILLRRATGGRVRALLLEKPGPSPFPIMLEGRGRLRPSDLLFSASGAAVRLVERVEGGVWRADLERGDPEELLATGRMPLPPYIKRDPTGDDPRDPLDRERYQTVFAARDGAVAAPTAGLHFTPEILAALAEGGVEVERLTLHVGPGTFLPVRTDDVRLHRMHAERYEVPVALVRAFERARARGRRVVAVGTTVVRALEAAFDGHRLVAGSGVTDLFIHPPFRFRAVDAMLTNFHLPESTLLMLVAAFAGRKRVLAAYRVALDAGYRFFSYGDAMLIR